VSNCFARTLVALALFGISFGFVEAAVVVYLRTLYEPLHQQLAPGRAPGDLFPMIPLERIAVPNMEHVNLPATELAREAATLLMLAAAALAVGRTFRQWLAAFVLAFGLWDLAYYAFLCVLIGWPRSLLDWDLLFLLPVPWAAPVLAPALVALTMVVAGTAVLWREEAGRPVPLTWRHLLGLVAGGLIMILAFCWQSEEVLTASRPEWFNWPLFLVGLGVGAATFLHAFAAGRLAVAAPLAAANEAK
jgi:hypothetical protein